MGLLQSSVLQVLSPILPRRLPALLLSLVCTRCQLEYSLIRRNSSHSLSIIIYGSLSCLSLRLLPHLCQAEKSVHKNRVFQSNETFEFDTVLSSVFLSVDLCYLNFLFVCMISLYFPSC
ncbi:hypothetical protein CROQUDRAFT_188079 [Cronartium quercuum f. sp. fusiforme G11]|uniref:Uncharacterized protein n=1 Tax=Cronartium quercuum f. sp. fusiforme G11 TaxID=708437 RepID=A0A9P6NGP2_9BASI|nr:hypothetical protein CROQUDRAFT_188079 [Cronartium quercuum f. sp. fusiforme G11]